MKSKTANLSKITISLLIMISVLLNNLVYAEEIRLDSGLTLPITYLDSNRFEVTNNVYSKGRLLFSRGTVGGVNNGTGHVIDLDGNYHSFFGSQSSSNDISQTSSTKKTNLRLGDNGPKVLPLVGAAAATVVAVPVAFLLGYECEYRRDCGTALLPFAPAAFLAVKAFEHDE